jgi:hypothetical protein
VGVIQDFDFGRGCSGGGEAGRRYGREGGAGWHSASRAEEGGVVWLRVVGGDGGMLLAGGRR